MLKNFWQDIKDFINAYKGQGPIFYCGCIYLVLVYLRPHAIYPQLNILPWTQITILTGFGFMVLNGQFKFTAVHFWVTVFAGFVTLSVFNSQYPSISEHQVSNVWIFALEVLFLSNCARDHQQFRLLMAVLFLCVLKMSFFGARVWVERGFGFTGWGIQGPAGFFLNSGEFSLLMAVIAVLSIPFFLAIPIKRVYFWLLPITATMTVMGASSRGGQLALLAGLIYLALAYKKIKLKNILIGCSIAWVAWVIFPEEQKSRFQSMGDDNTSTSRFKYWEAGIQMTKENPLFGVGLAAFPEEYNQKYKEHEGSFLSNRREVAHNSLVQVAASSGIPAVIAYIFLHFLIFFPYRIGRSVNTIEGGSAIHYRRAFQASVITYFIGAFFMSVVYYPYIYLLLGLSISAKLTCIVKLSEKPAKTKTL